MTPSLPSNDTRCEKSPAIAALTMPPTAASNSFITLAAAASRSAAARRAASAFSSIARRSRSAFSAASRRSRSAFSVSSRVFSIAASRNTNTACAIVPISSPRSVPGTSIEVSPPARMPMAPTNCPTGRVIDSATKTLNPAAAASIATNSARIPQKLQRASLATPRTVVTRSSDSRASTGLRASIYLVVASNHWAALTPPTFPLNGDSAPAVRIRATSSMPADCKACVAISISTGVALFSNAANCASCIALKRMKLRWTSGANSPLVNPTTPVARSWPANSLRLRMEDNAADARMIRASSLIPLIELDHTDQMTDNAGIVT